MAPIRKTTSYKLARSRRLPSRETILDELTLDPRPWPPKRQAGRSTPDEGNYLISRTIHSAKGNRSGNPVFHDETACSMAVLQSDPCTAAPAEKARKRRRSFTSPLNPARRQHAPDRSGSDSVRAFTTQQWRDGNVTDSAGRDLFPISQSHKFHGCAWPVARGPDQRGPMVHAEKGRYSGGAAPTCKLERMRKKKNIAKTFERAQKASHAMILMRGRQGFWRRRILR